jgi:hypothetical protein
LSDKGAITNVAIGHAPTKACKEGKETQITWSETGPQGDTGPAGPTGPTGPAGPQGEQGPGCEDCQRRLDELEAQVGELEARIEALEGGDGGCAGTPYGARWCVNGDGTVTDLTTGLVWLQNANCYGRQVWADAVSIPGGLNSGECGLDDASSEGDWVLPRLNEFTTLVEGDESILASTPGPFTNVQSSAYWSSTTDARYPGTALAVGLHDGYANLADVDLASYVWPVRGGP